MDACWLKWATKDIATVFPCLFRSGLLQRTRAGSSLFRRVFLDQGRDCQRQLVLIKARPISQRFVKLDCQRQLEFDVDDLNPQSRMVRFHYSLLRRLLITRLLAPRLRRCCKGSASMLPIENCSGQGQDNIFVLENFSTFCRSAQITAQDVRRNLLFCVWSNAQCVLTDCVLFSVLK